MDQKTPRRTGRTIEHAEYLRLRQATPPQWRSHLALLVGTGLSPGEIDRLQARDLDIEQRVLAVSGRARRQIPVSAAIAAILARQRTGKDPGEPLLPTWGSQRHQLPVYCRKAGLEPLTARDLQRTFVSWLAAAGACECMARALVGSNSGALIAEIMPPLGMGDLRNAIEKLPAIDGDDHDL